MATQKEAHSEILKRRGKLGDWDGAVGDQAVALHAYFQQLARYHAWATQRLVREHVDALTALGQPAPELDWIRLLQASTNTSTQ